MNMTRLSFCCKVPFLPSSVNTTKASEHNILATVSEALKRAEDPSQMQALAHLYAKLSVTTGVETPYVFVGSEENANQLQNALGSAISPVTSQTGTVDGPGSRSIQLADAERSNEGGVAREGAPRRAFSPSKRGRGRANLGAEAQDAIMEEQRAELQKVRV
jgi:hypothetical protein